MPVNKYFGGHGEEVMKAMKKQYGGKKGEQVFYATSNKRSAGIGPSHQTAKKFLAGKAKT